MKKIILWTVMVLCSVGVFQAFGAAIFSDSLTSTTYIEANQSFVLGEGRHDGYAAKVVNKGEVDVEVFSAFENEPRKSLGVLKPDDKDEYQVTKNTQIIFKNLGAKKAVIGIKLAGDTNLSMGYKPNKQ